jgi:hypothetical protein
MRIGAIRSARTRRVIVRTVMAAADGAFDIGSDNADVAQHVIVELT